MGSLNRLEPEGARILRAVSSSSCIRFGSDAPWSPGTVHFHRYGFADIVAVGFVARCYARDASALVPEARQHILRAVAERALPVAALDLCVQVQASTRGRSFVDVKTGKRCMGTNVFYSLELSDRQLAPRFSAALGVSYERGY